MVVVTIAAHLGLNMKILKYVVITHLFRLIYALRYVRIQTEPCPSILCVHSVQISVCLLVACG